MKISVIVAVALGALFIGEAHSEIRYKIRGPPGPPRPPPPPPYYTTKSKWPVPARYPMRNVRPIPLHVPLHKSPPFYKPAKAPQFLSGAPKVHAPYVFSGAVWKSPQPVYKPPVDKPLLSFPTINEPFDFAVSKEQLVHLPTIKQVGEKGPIHTIPAPNLSPADKPAGILDEGLQQHVYHYEKEPDISSNSIALGPLPLVSHQKHQYQVTEQSEHAHSTINNNNDNNNNGNSGHFAQSQFGQKPLFAPDPDQNTLGHRYPAYLEAAAVPSDQKLFSSDVFVAQPQSASSHEMHLSAQDLYQLLNGAPQQPLVDSYGTPVLQQQHHHHLFQQQQQPQQQQQHFTQHTPPPSPSYALMHSHLFQEEPAYVNQVGDGVSQAVKDNFRPQFHTFNYEEQASQPASEFAQSRVTADYSLEQAGAADGVHSASVQSANEALAQSQYVQQYFGAQAERANEVGVDADGDEQARQPPREGSHALSAGDISPSMFYSSLPSKDAADAFASLQAAASVHNEQQQQQDERRAPAGIYVPDEDEPLEEDAAAPGEAADAGIRVYETTYADAQRGDSAEYEDYSQERDEAGRGAFGSRLRPQGPRDAAP